MVLRKWRRSLCRASGKLVLGIRRQLREVSDLGKEMWILFTIKRTIRPI